MRSKRSRISQITGTLAAGAAALAYTAYRRDLEAARRRIATGAQIIESAEGPIEFAESGNGPAVLVIHGAGGGFDQGLDLGRGILGEGFRIIAPSRFGYLGTPMPADACAEAQADAHLRVLDALGVDRVPVIGVSAGAPSAMQLCLRHPERCAALVLAVPLVFTPNRVATDARSPLFKAVLNAIVASDLVFWTVMKTAHSAVLQTVLGTPVRVYRDATTDERRIVDTALRHILPISRRAAGIWNDTVVSSSLTRYRLEDIRVPTLVISAADDLYGTYDGALYTANEIRDAKFVGFATGGHLLVGHDAEVRSAVTHFVKEHLEAAAATAIAS